MTDNPNPPNPPDAKAVNDQEIEDFFRRLPANFRWPKPSADAVAAAAESIQRMTNGSATAQEWAEAASACAECGGSLPAGARFCVWCGLPKEVGAAATNQHADPTLQRPAAQHHVHHHYHHFVPGQRTPFGAPAAESETLGPRGRAPASVEKGSAGKGSAGHAPGGRAEVAARQVVQDWAQACNIRHIDDLVELYAADAILIRSSVPPVRSLPAIREFLLSMLEAGFGDVQMESLRFEMMGEIAMDIGRCEMLVPVAMGKRREERGKYLVVLVRQPTGTWKILADCWSNDLPAAAPPTHHAQKGK